MEMFTNFNIAHEMGHIFKAELFNKYGKQSTTKNILAWEGKTKNKNRDTKFINDLREEIFADVLAVTALKEYYGNSAEFKTFLKKLRFYRMGESSYTYPIDDYHFIAPLYIGGIDFVNSFTFSPKDLARMVQEVEKRVDFAYIALKPTVDENDIKKQFDLIQSWKCYDPSRNLLKRYCFYEYGIDEKVSTMTWEQFRQTYYNEIAKLERTYGVKLIK